MYEMELRRIADNANMVIKGYAFSYIENNISVINLNRPERAVVISKEGKILESNTDDIEEALIIKIWSEDKEFMEVWLWQMKELCMMRT